MAEKTTKDKLLEVSELSQSIATDLNKLLYLFKNDREMMNTDTFMMLHSGGAVTDFSQTVKNTHRCAKSESEDWDQIQNISNCYLFNRTIS